MVSEIEKNEALESLKNAILNYDAEESQKTAQLIVDKGIDPMLAIRDVLGKTAGVMHERFDSGECFLPHLVLAGDAMVAASKVLEAAIPKDTLQEKKVIVIGTVEADLHSVGKNIVAMMLRASGFEVHDLGVDVKAGAFISKANDTNADIIAVSSLLTTTRPYQREIIEELESKGLRNKFKVIVGGGPITREWAEEIGADGYGADALEGVEIAKKMCDLS
ncbi:B12-binding domain-containing protein [Chloroflexota bacterium]